MNIKNIWALLNKELPGTRVQDQKDISYQVMNYDKIGFCKSARGTAAWLLLFYVLIITVDVLQGSKSVSFFILYAIVYMSLVFLVYKGKKWAMVAAMLIWTADRLMEFIQSNNWITLILWFIVFSALGQAYNIEKVRHKNFNGKDTILAEK